MKLLPVILFAGFMAFFAWATAVPALKTLWHQHAAESFPHVQGVVMNSTVVVRHGSRGGVSYRVAITYSYDADILVGCVGRRYRYDNFPSDVVSVTGLVGAHPKGSLVEVYYNPRNPLDTVLSTPVVARDVALPLVLAVWYLFMVWMLINLFRRSDWGRSPVAGGLKVIQETRVTRLRLPRYQPLMLGLMTGAGLSLVSGILIGASVLRPPWEAGEAALASVVLGGMAVYAWYGWRLRLGRQDLVIDEVARTLQFPVYKRGEPVTASFSQVRAIALEKVRHQGRGRAWYSYKVTLELTNGSKQKLADLTKLRAESLAAWLREKLGLPEASVEGSDQKFGGYAATSSVEN